MQLPNLDIDDPPIFNINWSIRWLSTPHYEHSYLTLSFNLKVKYDVDGLQASRRRKPLTSDVPAVDSFKKLLAAEKSPFLSPPMNGAQESYMSNLDAQASRKRFNS